MKLSAFLLLLMFLFNGCAVNVYHHKGHGKKSCCEKEWKSSGKSKCEGGICKIKSDCNECKKGKKECGDCKDSKKCTTGYCPTKENSKNKKKCCNS